MAFSHAAGWASNVTDLPSLSTFTLSTLAVFKTSLTALTHWPQHRCRPSTLHLAASWGEAWNCPTSSSTTATANSWRMDHLPVKGITQTLATSYQAQTLPQAQNSQFCFRKARNL